jgi:intracellular septation protein
MSALIDLLPVLAFFVAYKLAGIYVATTVLMVATVLQVGYTYWRKRTVPQLTLGSAVLLLVFGAATLYFHSPTALMWMPTVLYGAFALAFGASHLTNATLIERALGAHVAAPQRIWAIANASWVVFFLALAVINYWVLSHYALDSWVRFKLIKAGALFLFAIGQTLWLMRHAHVIGADTPPPTEGTP